MKHLFISKEGLLKTVNTERKYPIGYRILIGKWTYVVKGAKCYTKGEIEYNIEEVT